LAPPETASALPCAVAQSTCSFGVCVPAAMAAERIVVVGGGLAGLSATCELLERGCNVTIIEKEDNLGGNSSKATTGVAVPGSYLQAAAGVADSGADLIADEGEAAKRFVETGSEDANWLMKILAVDSELVLRLTPGHGKTARTIGTKTHFPGAVLTYALIHLLQEVAQGRPDRLQIISSARVTKLLTAGTRVVGVEFSREEGPVENLKGNVVITAGGYAGDLEKGSLVAKHAAKFMKFATTNDERANGDSITLASAVGAGTANLDKVQLTPFAAVLPGQADAQFKVVVSDALAGAGGKLIDATGKRFCDEMKSAQECAEAMARARAPFRLVINAKQAEPVHWLVEFYTQRRVMKKFSSVGELASVMRVSGSAMDPALQGSGVLYVAEVTAALYTCSGGLNAGWTRDLAGKVLNAAGQPIAGLFAAGEATSVPFPKLWSVSGIPMLYCIYSGRMAGRAAAAAVPTNGSVVQSLREIMGSAMDKPSNGIKPTNGAAPEEKKPEEKPLEEMTTEELIAKIKDLEANGSLRAPPADDGPKGITMEEVKKHSTKEDAWLVVNGDVIDVTKWIPIHPGGEQAVVAYLGQDASDEWNMIHKAGTIEKNLVPEGGNGPVLKGKLGGAAAPVAAAGGAAGGSGTAAPTGLTLDDVAKHNKESDLWVVVNGKAYDVTKWLHVHPGGVQAITAYAGKDATDEWNCIHKPGTIEKNLFPANPNGPVDMGAVSGAAAAAAPAAVADDEKPPPDGNGGIPGILGAIIFLGLNIVLMLSRTVFFTGNVLFKLENNRNGTIRSACMLLVFTVIHVVGNFLALFSGPDELNGEGYFFDRQVWTGGFGIIKDPPLGLAEEYIALALLLHVSVALKRSWDISMNYCLNTGRWNMLLSGLTILFFITMHLRDIKFNPNTQYTMMRVPPYWINFSGLLEGHVFFSSDPSVPLVRVRDIYSVMVGVFKDFGTCILYTLCVLVFWAHMLLGWKKLVPADAMQIPRDHVKMVTYLGWLAATAVASMYLTVLWYTYYMPPIKIEHVM